MSGQAATNTQNWIERRQRVVARGVGMFSGDMTVASASGATLITADGKPMIDFAGGIGVMNVGHCEPSVVAAIQKQAAALLHTCFNVATIEPYVELCEKLVELLPHGPAGQTRVMLVNTGAEAVENAVKIARQSTRRPAIFVYDGAFHGRTLLGMTMTAKAANKKHCGPFAPEVYRLPFPNHKRFGAGLSEGAYVERELARLRERFVTGAVPAEHVAAIVIEPVQGEGGFHVAPPAYLRGLRQICDEHGILLVIDEVQTGFGRTGRWGAFEHSGVTPDISTWAKSLGGGLPIGAVIGKANVMDAAEPGTLGGTYAGNPVACAGALAALRALEERGLNRRAEEIGARVRERFEKLQAKHRVICDVRGLGAMVALEMCHGGDFEKPAGELTQKVVTRCRQEGLLVLTAGPHGNCIRFLAPLVISEAELQRGLDLLEAAIGAELR